MKKLSVVIFGFIIIFTFISCSIDKANDSNKDSTNSVNHTISTEKSKLDNKKYDNSNLEYKGKTVSEVRLNGNVNFELNIDLETLKSLENAENDAFVPDVTLDTELGTIEIIYTDETTEALGTVYISSDNALYLKFDKDKNVAYKLSNSIF